MKRKTSITLSEDILKKVEAQAEKGETRSGVIERLLRHCLTNQANQTAEAKDLETINRNAQKLTHEALDVLDYQEQD